MSICSTKNKRQFAFGEGELQQGAEQELNNKVQRSVNPPPSRRGTVTSCHTGELSELHDAMMTAISPANPNYCKGRYCVVGPNTYCIVRPNSM
jgi:hypothetical protein